MRRRLRRSLLCTTLLSLVLAVSGFAANPPNTKVAGIDVDATTIPQLEALMNSHRINAVNLTDFYLHRIKQLQPDLHAVITVSPTAHVQVPVLGEVRELRTQLFEQARRPLLDAFGALRREHLRRFQMALLP